MTKKNDCEVRQIPEIGSEKIFTNLGKDVVPLKNGNLLNCSSIPENCSFASMQEIVCPDAPEDIYISPVGCYGIIRRTRERKIKINPRLETILLSISEEMTLEEIEKRSRVQKRGRFSKLVELGEDRLDTEILLDSSMKKENKITPTGKNANIEINKSFERPLSFSDFI